MQRDTTAAGLAAMPELLTFDDVARVCQVDPRTVARWCAQGRLKRVKLCPGRSGAARILKASLLQLLERGAA